MTRPPEYAERERRRHRAKTRAETVLAARYPRHFGRLLISEGANCCPTCTRPYPRHGAEAHRAYAAAWARARRRLARERAAEFAALLAKDGFTYTPAPPITTP